MFQDRVHQSCSFSENVDIQHRPEGHLFLHSRAPLGQNVPTVIPVQSPSFSSASWLFTMVARKFALLIHNQYKALHKFLCRAMSKECCAKHRDLVRLVCKELGLLVNLEKSELIPKQVFTFVGIHFDLISFTANASLENWIKVISLTQASSLPAVHHQAPPGPIHSGSISLHPFLPSTVEPILVLEPVSGPSEHQGSCARKHTAGSTFSGTPLLWAGGAHLDRDMFKEKWASPD